MRLFRKKVEGLVGHWDRISTHTWRRTSSICKKVASKAARNSFLVVQFHIPCFQFGFIFLAAKQLMLGTFSQTIALKTGTVENSNKVPLDTNILEMWTQIFHCASLAYFWVNLRSMTFLFLSIFIYCLHFSCDYIFFSIMIEICFLKCKFLMMMMPVGLFFEHSTFT